MNGSPTFKELARAALKANVKNLFLRVQSGKPLTDAQLKLIENEAEYVEKSKSVDKAELLAALAEIRAQVIDGEECAPLIDQLVENIQNGESDEGSEEEQG